MTSSGIELAPFRLVPYCLNHVHYRVSPVFLLRIVHNVELCGRVTINLDLVEDCYGLFQGNIPKLTSKF
jgi:hypothetical protein